MFDILSIPLFIISSSIKEFSAFDPIVRQILAKSGPSPLPVCPFLEFLYLLILASLSRRDVQGAYLTFFITVADLAGPGLILPLFLFLGPILLLFFI